MGARVSGFDGSGATPGWPGFLYWIRGYAGVFVWWPDAKRDVACSPFEECGPVWRMRMEEPAAPRRFPPVSFSLFFPQLFLFSFVGVLVMLALSLSFGTRVPFWRMANMATPSGGMWNQTFSVAGLNTTVSQDGLRCNPTRTASVFLWPRTAENAGGGDVRVLHQYAFDGLPLWSDLDTQVGFFVTCVRACMHGCATLPWQVGWGLARGRGTSVLATREGSVAKEWRARRMLRG